jgi:hypothetical protein
MQKQLVLNHFCLGVDERYFVWKEWFDEAARFYGISSASSETDVVLVKCFIR